MTCGDERFRHAAGPYLLGALDAGESADFAGHLGSCPACEEEVARLRPVVGALSAVTAADVAGWDDTAGPATGFVAPPAGASGAPSGQASAPAERGLPPMPDTLLPGLLARAARSRRRRRTLVAAVGAVAAAAVIALTVVLVTASSGRNPAPDVAGQVVTMRSVDGGNLSATATVTGMPWGTEITLHCHYRGSRPAGSDRPPPYGRPVYLLTVIDSDGAVHPVGSWVAPTDRETVFTGGTAVPPGEIGRIEVVGADGTPVLSAAG